MHLKKKQKKKTKRNMPQGSRKLVSSAFNMGKYHKHQLKRQQTSGKCHVVTLYRALQKQRNSPLMYLNKGRKLSHIYY